VISLVTGATGFIGSHVIDELLARAEPVRALVRNPIQAAALQERGVEVIVGDIRSPQILAAAVRGVDVIQHCAAAVGAHFSREEIYATNLGGVRNLLEAVRQTQCGRVVLVSSINVLGTRDLDRATEDLPCRRSHDPAADVKIEAEELARQFHELGVDLTIVRPGFVYGPGDRHSLPPLVGAIERGRFAFIRSRDNVVPIVHVRDVAQALAQAGTTPAARGRVYHITDGSRTTIGALVDCLAELLGCAPPRRVLRYVLPYLACVVWETLGRVRQPRRPAPITRAGLRFLGTSRFVDIRRARDELGYVPRIALREGMAATIQWVKAQRTETNHVASTAVRPTA
jgi:nucleoside-diphosphate-sugar epimerase